MPGGETPPFGASHGIVKAARVAVEEALAKLDEIPMIDDEHVSVPWPEVDRPKLDPKVWEDSTVQAVVITDLYASQPRLRKQTVVDYIKAQGAPERGRRAMPNVYAIDGRNVIVDGHHKLAAMWLLGAEVVNSWFLED